MTSRRPPRLSAECYRGGNRIFLTMCTFGRRKHFEDDAIVDLLRSELLRREEATADVIRYIVENPVRAGLCTDAGEYPFTGSSRLKAAELIASLG
jgi:hypothetical protein